jgi:hypothetical protein
MARKIVNLAIFLLIANALYRFVPVYFHYQQFKDAVHETALFSRERTEAQVIDQVMDLAAKYQIPLSREYVQVRRENERTMIDASYVETIEWVPTYRRNWQFDVGEQAFTNVRPSHPADVGR